MRGAPGSRRHALPGVRRLARTTGSYPAIGGRDRNFCPTPPVWPDASLYPGAATSDTYVRDGRRLAERVLTPFDWPIARQARLGDAIERHHELRRQWSRGAEVELLRRADLVDVSQGLVRFGLERVWLRALRRTVSPRGMLREVGRLVATAARERPLTLPAIFIRR